MKDKTTLTTPLYITPPMFFWTHLFLSWWPFEQWPPAPSSALPLRPSFPPPSVSSPIAPAAPLPSLSAMGPTPRRAPSKASSTASWRSFEPRANAARSASPPPLPSTLQLSPSPSLPNYAYCHIFNSKSCNIYYAVSGLEDENRWISKL